jgi:hypothetical protein
MAIGFRTVKGTGSAMLFCPPLDLPTKVRLTIEYRTEAVLGGMNVRFLQTRPAFAKAVDVKMLPPTNGRWETATVDADLTGATGGYFELHNNNPPGVSGDIRVRKFVVTDPSAQASAAPAFPKSQAAAVPLKADFAAFGVGTYSLDKTGVNPADGWSANQFDADATGELTTANESAGKAVTLTNTAGTPSAQLYQNKPGGTLAAGTAYLLKVEYKAATGTSGLLDARENDVGNWKDCPYSFKLESTEGKWETRTFEIEAARDYPAVFVIQNRSAEPGNALAVRKLEIVPLGGK